MSPTKDTQKSAKSTTAIKEKFKAFTDEERAAMKEYLQERKASAGRGPRADKADGESALLAKIAEMREPDRAMAKRSHESTKPTPPPLPTRTSDRTPATATARSAR